MNFYKTSFLDYNIHLWGIGDIQKCMIKESYSLSFPLNKSLLDRNIFIHFEEENIIIENDWLGSIPVFYNPKELIVSTISSHCIKGKDINSEGLNDYCAFGYSVFEQTPFENVKFMRYYSKLLVFGDKIEIDYKEDIVFSKAFECQSSVDEVVYKIKDYINNIEKSLNKKVVMPVSGGFDSRFLLSLLDNKKNLNSYTYGISENQVESFEVVYAKKLTELLGVNWHQIELNKYNAYIDEWFKIYGISTHTHGMYHIEFYKNIQKTYYTENNTFLSGIFGDIWAGSINYNSVNSYEDIIALGYSHRINLDSTYVKAASSQKALKQFFETHQDLLKDDRFKAITTIRLKIILISYLCQIPEYFGMPVWTPFLNFENVMAMLNLPKELRKNRKWQIDYFDKLGLNLGKMNLQATKSNDLNYKIGPKTIVEELDIELMSKYIDINKLNEINTIIQVASKKEQIYTKDIYLKALSEYYTILAIQKGLKHGS
ncbi:MAG: hypothetical protein PHS78_09050 [Aliarcobacter skirrowii]|nr:hypothetical protein [Aliarcobacter skirrowii]